MNTGSHWNSLEVAKLLVSALTPIVVVVLGIWIARVTKRLEQGQWTSRKIIERRIDVYDEIAPLLNDLVVYFTFVGHWKDLRPSQLVETKRILDRRVHISESLFSQDFLLSYRVFIQSCFSTYQGPGVDARLRGDPGLHIQAAGPTWDPVWTKLFTAERDWVEPSQILNSYKKLMLVLAEELQLDLGNHMGAGQGHARRLDHTELDQVRSVARDSEITRFRAVFPRTLPAELNATAPSSTVDRTNRKVWPNGTTIRVYMSGGSTEQQEFVQTCALLWTEHAHLMFAFVKELPAEVRVTFDPSKGSWSYIGTDCKEIQNTDATMNIASVDQGTVLHLFGLVLGLTPTFQNPFGGIDWDLEAIHRDLSVCDEYSTIQSVQIFVSINLSSDQFSGTAFDPSSVMQMPIPEHWSPGFAGSRMNTELSDPDQGLAEMLYPYTGKASI